MRRLLNWIRPYGKCPRCGYFAFDGYECHDLRVSPMNRIRTKTRTIYNEKYVNRAVHVTQSEALKIAEEASCIYAVEQGELEIPSFENQRRLVCVLRFERILPKESNGQ